MPVEDIPDGAKRAILLLEGWEEGNTGKWRKRGVDDGRGVYPGSMQLKWHTLKNAFWLYQLENQWHARPPK